MASNEHTVSKWDNKQVEQWFVINQLNTSILDNLKPCDGNTIQQNTLDGNAIKQNTTLDPSCNISGYSITSGLVDATRISGSLVTATLPGENIRGDISANLLVGDISANLLVGDISGTRVRVNGNTITANTVNGSALIFGTDISGVRIDGGSIVARTLAGSALIIGTDISGVDIIGGSISSGTDISGVRIDGGSIVARTLAGSALIIGTDISGVDIIGGSISSGTDISGVNIDGESIKGSITTATLPITNVTYTTPSFITFDASGIATTPGGFSPGVYALYAKGSVATASIFTTAYYGPTTPGSYWFISPVTNNSGTVITLSATADFLNLKVVPAGTLTKLYYSPISNVQFPTT